MIVYLQSLNAKAWRSIVNEYKPLKSQENEVEEKNRRELWTLIEWNEPKGSDLREKGLIGYT